MPHELDAESRSELRSRLALALDYADLDTALKLASDLQPWFSVAKVGLELFTAVGPKSVDALRTMGFDVFLDLKLHDIPTTVAKAAYAAGALGARYLTMHSLGGESMLRAGLESFHEAASSGGLVSVFGLGVTVLTSDSLHSPDLLAERVRVASNAGCDGLICAGTDLDEVRELAGSKILVVPGTRMEGGDTHDQVRTTTPLQAISNGADLLVIGRMVTGAPDPRAAAEALVAHLSSVRPLGRLAR